MTELMAASKHLAWLLNQEDGAACLWQRRAAASLRSAESVGTGSFGSFFIFK